MEREEIERLKARFKPIMDRGRKWFGSEVYDNHIRDVLKCFDMDVNREDIKEIFDLE